MRLHPLPPETECPYCHTGGLAFVRERGMQGDLYRCTAATPCKGQSLHHRRNRGACGVSVEATSGNLLNWAECAGQAPAPTPSEEMSEVHLTTRQAAGRLRVSQKMVIDLLTSGKLAGMKIGVRWQISAAAVRKYNKTAFVARRVTKYVWSR